MENEKLILNDFILKIEDKTKKQRFERFIRYKGYSNPNTDIIEFFKLILTKPEWFKNLNHDSFKSINTKKNIVSNLKCIWKYDIIKKYIDNDNYSSVSKELMKFYNEIAKEDCKINFIKDEIKLMKSDIENLTKRLSKISMLIEETIYNI